MRILMAAGAWVVLMTGVQWWIGPAPAQVTWGLGEKLECDDYWCRPIAPTTLAATLAGEDVRNQTEREAQRDRPHTIIPLMPYAPLFKGR